ncbi:biotin-dependent carboxyltransferase family protein [Planosporangium thailandense]|uniref:5-oxoprolinase subunit C family protein n=1 Tax=Planosporangium thailandense TaxID=765197 RepID=UPI003B82F092
MGRGAESAGPAGSGYQGAVRGGARVIEVVAPGPLSTVQDLGRAGYAALGVPRSGAADERSFRLANRLVGNQETAAGIEATFGGLRLRFHAPTTVALTGAPVPVTVDNRQVGMNAPLRIRAGSRLVMGSPAEGVRTYLAVRGGIAVPPVLGSRSTDVLSGLGPAVLSIGQTIPIGQETAHWPNVDLAPTPPIPAEVTLRVSCGPREEWFTPEALTTLVSQPYQVTTNSNRIGLRLAGPVLDRALIDELPSEGMVGGALQVPPNGQPVLFLVDHPVTGGYPVIGVVLHDDLHLAAQLRPAQQVRFRYVST